MVHRILTAAWYAALAAYVADYLAWAFTERRVARHAGPAVIALTAAMLVGREVRPNARGLSGEYEGGPGDGP